MDKTIYLHVDNVYVTVRSENLSAINKLAMNLNRRQHGFQHSNKYKSGMWDGYVCFMEIGQKILTGLLPLVYFYLDKEEVPYKVIDHRVDPVKKLNPVLLKGVSMEGKYAYQKDAIQAIIDYKRGVVDAATNAGKSNIACGLYRALGLRTLFLTHREELFEQTEDNFESKLGETVGRIWGDSCDIDENLVMAMVPTLSRRLENKKGATAKEIALREALEYYLSVVDVVIIDESHHCIAPTYEGILKQCTNAYYRVGLSGTPFVYEDETKTIKSMGLLGYSLFNINNKELIEAGVSSTPHITLQSIKNWDDIKDYDIAYEKLVVTNEERNKSIVKYAKKFMSKKLPTLIIVNYELHGEAILKTMLDEGIDDEDVKFISGSTASQAKKDRKKYFDLFKEGKLPILIASLIVQEGISMDNIGGLIFALGGKSDTRVLQCLGRGLRLNNFGNTVEVVDFIDATDERLLAHSLARYEMYLGEGFDNYIEFKDFNGFDIMLDKVIGKSVNRQLAKSAIKRR